MYGVLMTTPFDLSNTAAYLAWRENKLSAYPLTLEKAFIPIINPNQPSDVEVGAIKHACNTVNQVRFFSVRADGKLHMRYSACLVN